MQCNKTMRFAFAVVTTVLFAGYETSVEADEYQDRRRQIERRDPGNRRVPVIPPKGQQIRVLIDSDAHNEIDDVWAIALAVLCPERFQIEGIVAANYDNKRPGGGPASIETSSRTVIDLLGKAGLSGTIPVKRGSAPMTYQYEPSESEGVDFIIDRAMASTPEDPLWVVGLGAATDIASAYLKEPRIADRIVVFWHFRTRWPKQCVNFNVFGDVRAARLVFHSDLSFVLFDTGTDLTCPMEESLKWRDYNPMGKYLHDFRLKDKYFQRPNKGFFDLGDIAALVDPDLATWEVVECPDVKLDLAYQFNGTKGRILRCAAIDRDKTFALFDHELKEGVAETIVNYHSIQPAAENGSQP
ncbi:MAG: nucleoside hydrolase [Planctomycetota bacterium]